MALEIENKNLKAELPKEATLEEMKNLKRKLEIANNELSKAEDVNRELSERRCMS